MSAPKDLVVEGREKIVRDKLVSFGKYKGQNKLFSDITSSDFEYCLELTKDFKNKISKKYFSRFIKIISDFKKVTNQPLQARASNPFKEKRHK